MIIATNQLASLSDAPPVSVISNALDWVSDLLFGPLATAIAVIAIAWIGITMLSGRIDIRRGVSVIFGCFLLFGARGVADGLWSTVFNENRQAISTVFPPPNFLMPPPASANNTNAFDPYAGAAVARPEQ